MQFHFCQGYLKVCLLMLLRNCSAGRFWENLLCRDGGRMPIVNLRCESILPAQRLLAVCVLFGDVFVSHVP